MFYDEKKEHFWHKGSLKAIIRSYFTLFCNILLYVIKLLFIKLL